MFKNEKWNVYIPSVVLLLLFFFFLFSSEECRLLFFSLFWCKYCLSIFSCAIFVDAVWHRHYYLIYSIVIVGTIMNHVEWTRWLHWCCYCNQQQPSVVLHRCYCQHCHAIMTSLSSISSLYKTKCGNSRCILRFFSVSSSSSTW